MMLCKDVQLRQFDVQRLERGERVVGSNSRSLTHGTALCAPVGAEEPHPDPWRVNCWRPDAAFTLDRSDNLEAKAGWHKSCG